MEANEEFVRSKWKDSPIGGLWLYESTRSYQLRLGDWKHNGSVKDKDAVWQAAADFTRQRLEEIRLIQEEVAHLGFFLAEDPERPEEEVVIYTRILKSREAALADLKRGTRQ